MINYILLALSVAALIGGFFWKRGITAQINSCEGRAPKSLLRRRTFSTLLIVIGGYLFFTRLLTLVFGAGEREEMHLSLWAERINLGGYSLSKTVLYMWFVMAFLIILALILRLTVLRRLETSPKGVQNALEIIVEQIMKYTDTQVPGIGEFLGSYIFSIAAFMVGCAALELFRLRAPTSDVMMTVSMALITFFFINWYGFKKKGMAGRFKALASPTPIVFIFRIISDIAIPVSLASRLFGNMLGGMIVMDLLYNALGANSAGLSGLLGLYFNIFHPLIQAFIFITLTLTFIHEATE